MDFAEKSGVPILRIRYEDILKNPKQKLDMIFKFLEIDTNYSLIERKIINLLHNKPQHPLVEKPDITRIDGWKSKLAKEIELFEYNSQEC